MNPEDHFQVVCPSNETRDLHPENRPNNYTTELAIPSVLEGSWEVALIDIQYPHPTRNFQVPVDIGFAFYTNNARGRRMVIKDELDKVIYKDMLDNNLELYNGETEGKNYIVLDENNRFLYSRNHAGMLIDEREPPTERALQPLYSKINVNRGVAFLMTKDDYYITQHDFVYGRTRIEPQQMKTVEMLCQKVNRALRDIMDIVDQHTEQPPQFYYNEETERIQCKSGTVKGVLWCSSPYLLRLMGFNLPADLKAGPVKVTLDTHSDRPAELDLVRTMYVYTDIIQYQCIGRIQSPLLAVLPVIGEPKQQNYWLCQPPYYLAVNVRELKSINIRLATGTGDPFPIQGGDVVVRLDFRRKRVL